MLTSGQRLFIVVVFVVGVVMLFVTGVWQLWSGRTLTPELMGEAQTIILRAPESVDGLIWNGYAVFYLRGEGEGNRFSCSLRKIWGGDFYQLDGVVSCEMLWNQTGRFQGWIDFRGHQRAFCGAPGQETMPANCRLR